MSKKLSLIDINNYIQDISNSKLLSKEYINSKTPLEFQCECGNNFTRSIGSIQRSKSCICKECTNKKLSEERRKDINNIKKYISDYNCEYLSGEYINKFSILKIKCSCGEIFETSWDLFYRGRKCCSKCYWDALSKKKRKSFDIVLNEIKNGGCEYISGEYINNHSQLLLKCSCGNYFYKAMAEYNSGETHCPECGYKHGGELSRKYEISESPSMSIHKILRAKINPWVENIKKIYNNKCAITGKTNDLVVHHLKAFSTILNDAIEKYELDIKQRDNITVIPNNDVFEKIQKDVIESHTNDIGILISRDIHLQFHSIYGKGNNTPEQFDEFLKDNYSMNLSSILVI